MSGLSRFRTGWHIAATEVRDASGRVATVSTIRTDHDYETLVFAGPAGESFRDVDRDRYGSVRDAREGHAAMVGKTALALADGSVRLRNG